MNLNDPNVLRGLERELGLRGGLYDFVKMAWHVVEPGSTFRDNWHIRIICEALEKVSRGEIRKLLVNIPPGSMKSLLVCVFWPTWEWLRNPTKRWMFSSFDGSLTVRDAGKALALIGSDWFRERWHEYSVPKDSAKGHYTNDLGGWRFATSVNGKTTGHHPDVVVVDDPTKPKEATLDNLKKVQDWWKDTIISRGRDQETVCRVVIMQRLHEEDLAGYLPTHEDGWTVLSFPMEYEPARACVEDPRTEAGELFWPSRYSLKVVASLKKDLGPRVWASQYQQWPSPDAGLIFKRPWFMKRWNEVPSYWDDACQSWDLAFKGNDGSDYVVCTVWIKWRNEFYLVDRFRERIGFVGACQAIVDMKAKWPRITKILVEDKANGPAAQDQLRKKVPGIVMVNPRGDKLARASAIAPYFEAENVLLPPDAWWVSDYIEEMATFPTGANDDQVDTTSQALDVLGIQSRDLEKAMQNGAGMMQALLGGV